MCGPVQYSVFERVRERGGVTQYRVCVCERKGRGSNEYDAV